MRSGGVRINWNLHTGDAGLVRLQRDEDVRGLDLVFLRELGHDGVSQQGRVVRSQGRVCGYNDALRPAEFDNVFLRARSKTKR